MRSRRGRFIPGLALLLALLGLAWACGPFFPQWLLTDSEGNALAAPRSRFLAELLRLRPAGRSVHPGVPPLGGGQAELNQEVERAELREVLAQAGLAGDELERRLAAAGEVRRTLDRHAAAMAQWQADRAEPFAEPRPKPVFAGVDLPPGLPAEFTDYLQGAAAYHSGETNAARAAWTALLARPAAERRHRSTWAAYMLGRLDVDHDPGEAVKRFQHVRELARAGWPDPLGLAAASLGWEARAAWRQGQHREAIELYLEQIAAGANHEAMRQAAVVSVRIVVEDAFRQGEKAVQPLAAAAVTRSVVTAWLAGLAHRSWFEAEPTQEPADALWLRLLEAQPEGRVELAPQLALIAYQTGAYEAVERWLKRSPPDDPLTDWLQAKLLLRAGKLDAAAARLARLVGQFPPLPVRADEAVPDTRLDRLEAADPWGEYPPLGGRRQVSGELGLVQLQRGEYVRALDALLRGGFWMDAAYVAERVLTLAELQRYVDQNWPPRPDPEALAERQRGEDPGGQLRALLARRLARAGRLTVATPYYPPDVRELHERRQRLLAVGGQARRPAVERGRALWDAARLTREHGLDLLGTEVGPDWAIHGGNFAFGVDEEVRWSQSTNLVLRPRPEELARAKAHGLPAVPRWHYRFVAADLAWEAAQLLPDQTDETARVLHTAGSWIKFQDPPAADRFYKALVRRCGRTELGRVADRMRWFPLLDAQGKPFIPPPKPKVVEPVDSFPLL